MSHSIASASESDEGPSGDHSSTSRSRIGDHAVDLLRLLNQSVDFCRYSHEALAVAMGKDRGYVTKVLSADKPLGASFLIALPGDVSARFSKLYAEAHGHIVVQPVTTFEEALPMFVAGFWGVLSMRAGLPARSTGQLKADMPVTAKRRSA